MTGVLQYAAATIGVAGVGVALALQSGGETVDLPHRTPWEALQRAAVVDGLRCLADFYQAHPEVPLPAYPAFNDNIIQARTDEEGAAIIKVIAAALGVEVITTTGGGQHLVAERSFGGVLLRAVYVPVAAMAEYNARQVYAESYRPDDHGEATT